MLKMHWNEQVTTREYYAVVEGVMEKKTDTITSYLKENTNNMVYSTKDPSGQKAITHYEVMERFSDITYLKLNLETGRTHQIRVHMASIGHPLLGDSVYGGDRTTFESKHRACIQGQCLHAGELHFTHPITGEEMHLTASMSQNMKKTVSLIFGSELTEII